MTTATQKPALRGREPNTGVEPVPVEYVGVPDAVRTTSDKMVEARSRYFDLVAEHERASETKREAQEADEAAIREALDAGKATPKPKAPAAIERAAEVERQIEPARALVVEAENAYLDTCRAHRDEWMAALRDARDEMEARQDRAIEEARQAKLALHNAELAYYEIDQLGDPSKIKNPGKANAFAILRFRPLTKLDKDDERRLAEFRSGRDGRRHEGGLMAA